MAKKAKSTTSGRKSERIIWTLDLLDFKPGPAKKQLRFAEDLFPDRKVEIQPTFVFRDIRGGQSNHYQWCTLLFKKVLSQFKSKSLRPGKIVTQIPPPYNVRAYVRALLNTPYTKRAHMILATTANRSGLNRFLLGSFAETLLLTCHKPLLFFSAGSRVPTSIKTIIFPTDFSDESFRAFKICVKRAAAVNAKILLFYAVNQRTFDPKLTKRYMEEKALTDKWVLWAEKSGVRITPIIEAAPENPASALIHFAIKKRVHLIVMASVSSPVEVILAGSTTRQVVRQAPVPVWVIPPGN
ncbi:MAG: universal stress protein [Bdellovibrionaceae bacterium]|nr:universal stress protein [Bdellovibrionales bacterium]MCB9082724.1 universal stress protein [Pseudobdellovibrionaceae bacterium]